MEWQQRQWDATNVDSTAALCDKWFELYPDAEEHVLLISNISGVAGRADFFERFQHSVTNLMSRLHDRVGTVLWIEPCMGTETKTLLPKVKALLQKHLPRWVPATWAAQAATPCAAYFVRHTADSAFWSNVTVQRIARD